MKIGYSKTFPILGKDQWEKIWVENEIQGTLSQQDIKNELYSLKKTVETFHWESLNAEKKKEQEIVIQTPAEPQTKIGMFIADIFSCTSLKVLDTYKLLVKGNPELQEAWNMQHATLSGKS